MKLMCKPSSCCGSMLAILALASVCWLVPGKAVPREQPQSKVQTPVPPKQTPAPPDVKVFSLRHASAADLAGVLRQLLGDNESRRIGVDVRSNSLIVAGPPEDMAAIEGILTRLDVAPARNEPPRSEVVSLHFTRADDHLLQELRSAIAGFGGSVNVDPTRNKVVVSGDEKILERVRSLLEQLDRPAAQGPSTADMQVRIVWLASGVPGKELPPPPPDLKNVITELAKLGVENPRQVTQTMVTAQPGGEFRLEGSGKLDEPYRLGISGKVLVDHGAGDNSRLQISLRITATSPAMPREISRLDTEITASLSHAVVLGMTPSATSTSVFVVQILPKK